MSLGGTGRPMGIRIRSVLIALALGAVGGCAGEADVVARGDSRCGEGEVAAECRSEALRIVDRHLVERDEEEELYSLTLRDAGIETTAYLRLPRDAAEPVSGVVLAAGRYAGREAANVIPRPLNLAVLAVEYPGEIPRRLLSPEAVRGIPRVRDTAERMPDVLVQAGAYLGALPEVDAERLGVMGVSFGVPFAAAAGRDRVFGAVVLAFGGAGLGDMIDANLPLRSRLLRGAATRMLSTWFSRLEPALHVGTISPKPLLIISALYDELIPHRSAVRLGEAARPPVSHVWLPTKHIGIQDRDLIGEVADLTTRFFDAAWTEGAIESSAGAIGGVRVVERGGEVGPGPGIGAEARPS